MNMMTRIALACLAAIVTLVGSASASSCIPSDLDDNGTVNTLDLGIMLSSWTLPPATACAGAACAADLNGDGAVNTLDLGIVLSSWGDPTFETGTFPASWIHGAPSCTPAPQPVLQVHQYNDDTWIIRQSKCSNFEGPFMYLLFGQDKVLMLDTGANDATLPLATTVYGIINQWLTAHRQASIQLIVAHSHAHGDHIAHDGQFIGQPNTTVVGTSLASVQTFFGISAASWPNQIVQYDLGGGRVLDVIPAPGHHTTHIVLYDRRTHLLLTGDTLYPGFLFISSFSQYRASIQRLVDFTAANPVCWVVGTHIEMSAIPGVAYPYGTTYQPNEHLLRLTRATLLELNAAVNAMAAAPHTEVHNDFIISP